MRRHWGGTILVEGARTTDGRLIEPSSVTWPRPFPLPLTQRNWEWEDIRVIGSIEEVMRVGCEIAARGVLFDTDLPEGSTLWVGGNLVLRGGELLSEGDDHTYVVTNGELVAAAVHDLGDSCWPQAFITIGREAVPVQGLHLSDGYDDGIVDVTRPAQPVRWVADE